MSTNSGSEIGYKKSPLLGKIELPSGERHTVGVRREVIPIVFVPGIMGSRLRVRRDPEQFAWKPDSKAWMLRNYLSKTAAERHSLLIGGFTYDSEYLRVDADDDDHSGPTGMWVFEAARLPGRGFWGVSWDSYGPLLSEMFRRESQGGWRADVQARFHLPVYAFGYNWTASAEYSGEQLAEFVDGLIKSYEGCEMVIIVTHSMGGLVARSAMAKEGFAGKVLGVVHGVQPVHGSPIAYWRMKGGFEGGGVLGSILGGSAAEVAAVLAHMPGGLQLLPSKMYMGGGPWLHFVNPVQAPSQLDSGDSVVSQPGNNNPYDSIYRRRGVFWRLVDPMHLNPSRQPQPPGAKCYQQSDCECKQSNCDCTPEWREFLGLLSTAEKFHDKIKGVKHANTRAFSGTGLDTPESVFYVAKSRVDTLTLQGWTAGGETGIDEVKKAVSSSVFWDTYEKSAYRCWVEVGLSQRVAFDLSRPKQDGDGTVPLVSAKGLELDDVESLNMCHAGFPLQKSFNDLEHEPAFKGKEGLEFVVKSIEDLCRVRSA